MNNLLLDEALNLQNRYLIKLQETKELLLENNASVAIGNLSSFWIENRKLVECILEYLQKPYDRFFFTGITSLGFDDLEHIPFLALGKLRILDDTILSNYQMATLSSSETFFAYMEKILIKQIEDSINILENFKGLIYIFPLRFLFSHSDEIADTAERLFLSLFEEDIKNFGEYYQKFSSIESIALGLKNELARYIKFREDEDERDSLEKRFEDYKAKNTLPLGADAGDNEIFLMSILGYFMQALDIFSVALSLEVYPYTRNKMPLQYITLLVINTNVGGLKGATDIERNILNVMWTCFVLHHRLPRTLVNDNLDIMVHKFNESNFSEKLLDEVRRLTSEGAFSPNTIEEHIESLINELTNDLS